MAQVAEFYGFKVFIDNDFEGSPNILVDYEEEHLRGHYNLEKCEFTDIVFPEYLIMVIQDWISDNINALKKMWEQKTISVLPEWEE